MKEVFYRSKDGSIVSELMPTCAYCEKFLISKSNKKYCSRECFNKKVARPETVLQLRCRNCHYSFISKADYHGGINFCSKKCTNLYNERTSPRPCKKCKTIIRFPLPSQVYCSISCRKEDKKAMPNDERLRKLRDYSRKKKYGDFSEVIGKLLDFERKAGVRKPLKKRV